MNPLMTALGSGMSAKKILEFLMRKSPDMKQKIGTALASGFSAEKIVSFFSKGQNFDKLRSSMEEDYPMQNNANPLVQAQNVRSQNLGTDMASGLQRQVGPALGTAAALGTSYALSRAIPKILQGEQQPIQSSPQTPIQSQKIQQIPQQPPVDNLSENIAQPIQPIQPEVISNPKEYLEKRGVLDKVKNSLARGNNPEQIAAEIGIKSSGKATIDPQLLQNIEEYAKTNPQEAQEIIEPKKIEKASLVASPQGIGEVKEIRNGKALVEVDGKIHKVEEKNLLKPPKEAAIEALELIKSFTPEEMRSTHHMINSYDEEDKKAFFVFHNGSAYIVDDISPEEYRELSEEIVQAKTTGESIIGKWATGEGSRGAAYNKIVKGVRDRKVVPEFKKKFRKLKVGYNLLSEWQRLLNEKD